MFHDSACAIQMKSLGDWSNIHWTM